MSADEPITERALKLRGQVGEEKWSHLVEKAKAHGKVVEEVLDHYRCGEGSLRNLLKELEPDVKWPTFLHWRRRYEGRSGPVWERLLDERAPKPRARISRPIRESACALRRADRSMNPATARQHLVAQHGRPGALCDASLRRIWAEEELRYVRQSRSQAETKQDAQEEEVQYFNGGGGLALVGAAEAELQVFHGLAAQALSAGGDTAKSQGEVSPGQVGLEERNERGQFTANYNQVWRRSVAPGEADERWRTDAGKRAQVGDARQPATPRR